MTLLLIGCSPFGIFDGDDPEEDEVSTEPKELQRFDEQVRVRKLWRSSAGEGQEDSKTKLQVAAYKNNLYTADPEGLVTAFNADDGDKVWQVELNAPLSGGVGTGGDLVVLGSLDGDVFALSAAGGEERWRVELSSEVLAPPTSNENTTLVQTQDGKVHGLSSSSGESLWRYQVELPVLTLRGTAAPVLTLGNMAVLGFANGHLIALNSRSGELVWEAPLVAGEGKTELDRMVDVNTPVVVGDLIYASAYQGKVSAISRGVGRELWSDTKSSYRSPAYGSGLLYVVDSDDSVYAYRASGGKQVWVNEDFSRRKLTQALAVGNFVAVADIEGYLHILSSQDGQVVGRVKVDGDGVTAPMLSKQSGANTPEQDTFYVLDNGGSLTAYRLDIKASK